jgi:hypothetical protein
MPSSNTKHQGGAVWASSLAQTTSLALSGAGATQATATAITSDISAFTTVAASSGAILPTPGNAGEDYVVANWGANALLLYPPVGHKANNGATNAAVSVAAGKTAHAFYCGALQWMVVVSA